MSTTTPATPYSGLTRKKKWVIPGQAFKPTPGSKNSGTEIDVDVEIQETEGIIMPGKKEIYGLPVHARLAIFYIRKLWQELEKKQLLSIHRDTKSLFDVLRGHFNSKKSQTFKKEDFLEALEKMDKRWEEANDWLIELLRNSFAITMDKSILLKTLSQPECEGIRYYLAMKRRPDNKHKQTDDIDLTDSEGNPVKLTLVTVGVDKEGTDLHYKYDKQYHSIDTIPDIENESLCTEYPRTPGIAEKYKIKLPALEPYVLYKYAMVKDEV
jgi:hypothetical protein